MSSSAQSFYGDDRPPDNILPKELNESTRSFYGDDRPRDNNSNKELNESVAKLPDMGNYSNTNTNTGLSENPNEYFNRPSVAPDSNDTFISPQQTTLTQPQQNTLDPQKMANEFQNEVMNAMCPPDYRTCKQVIPLEQVKKGWKMCGEKLQEQYNAFLVETDPNKKKIQKLFLKYLLENFYYINILDSYKDNHRSFRYIMKCPTTFVRENDTYTKDELKQKYNTWYIPKGKFDSFAKEIGLDSNIKAYYERDREQDVVYEFGETDTGRWFKKTFTRSSGGKKRNQSKKSKKSKKRRYSKRR